MPGRKAKTKAKAPAGPSLLEEVQEELHACREELYAERLAAMRAQEKANALQRQWDTLQPALEGDAMAAQAEAASLAEELEMARRQNAEHESTVAAMSAELQVLVEENKRLSDRCLQLVVDNAEADRRVSEAKARAEEELIVAQRALEGAFGEAVAETTEAARKVHEGTATMKNVRALERRLALSQREVAKLAGSQETVISRCEAAMAAERAARIEKDLALQQRDIMQRQLSELALALRTLEGTDRPGHPSDQGADAEVDFAGIAATPPACSPTGDSTAPSFRLMQLASAVKSSSGTHRDRAGSMSSAISGIARGRAGSADRQGNGTLSSRGAPVSARGLSSPYRYGQG